MSDYRIGKLNGRFVLVFDHAGRRRRFRLRAKDAMRLIVSRRESSQS